MFNKELILILQSWKCQSSVFTLNRVETPGHLLLWCFLHNRSWMSKDYRMNLMARKEVCAICVWCIWLNSFLIQSSETKTARCNVLCIGYVNAGKSDRMSKLSVKTLNIIVLHILFLFECAHPLSVHQFTCYYWLTHQLPVFQYYNECFRMLLLSINLSTGYFNHVISLYADIEALKEQKQALESQLLVTVSSIAFAKT